VSPAASGLAVVFDHPITYMVVAADGSIKFYIVTVSLADVSTTYKDITTYTFGFTGEVDTINGTTIIVKFPFQGAYKDDLVATFTTNSLAVDPVRVGSVVQASSTTVNDFSNILSPLLYTVTAQDGSTKIYSVFAYEVGPGGGLIFITPYNTNNITGQYFEAAPTDVVGTHAYSDITAEIGVTAQGISIGTGSSNTAAIMLQGASSGAAFQCDNLNLGGQTDWFLPSYDELTQMGAGINYSNYTAIGGLVTGNFYHSSTEYASAVNNSMASNMRGGFSGGSKAATFLVRCVRSGSENPNMTKRIISLGVGGRQGTIVGEDILVVVPLGTSLNSVAPTIIHNGASVSPASGTAQDFSSGPVEYTVTAVDSSQKVYAVTVEEGYIVGDVGPGGGKIFITPHTTGNTTGQYFETTTADIGGTYAYSNLTTAIGATGQGAAIGTGSSNTAAIITQGAASGAAYQCDNLDSGTKTDWFLPSKDELNQLYINRVAIGGFVTSGPNTFYWSSSEHAVANTAAWIYAFNGGVAMMSNKNISNVNVRCVRAF
jgi:hypothetical protein